MKNPRIAKKYAGLAALLMGTCWGGLQCTEILASLAATFF